MRTSQTLAPKSGEVLSRFSVRTRIIALCIVPMLGMGVVGTQQLLSSLRQSQEIAQVEITANQVPVVSAVVHELQKERGLSAGFIASKGANFAKDLLAQRAATDQALAAFDSAFSKKPSAGSETGFLSTVLDGRRALDTLVTMRGDISAFSATAPQMASFYTGAITTLLDGISDSAIGLNDAGTVLRLTALNELLLGKERAGLERATGTGMFASQTASQADYAKFVGLVNQQAALFSGFMTHATPALSKMLADVLDGQSAKTLQTYRDIQFSAPFGGSVDTVSGDQWFAAATRKIDEIKTVEDAAVKELTQYAAARKGETQSALMLFIGINALLFTATAILAFFVVRSITRPVLGLTRIMRRLADGELDIEIEGSNRADELGEMARTVEVFQANAIKVRDLTEEEKARIERTRVERAEMMQELKTAFGEVVDAAVAGDFSHRVSAEFPDAELNSLASSVNNLVETVHRGLVETGSVLASLANTDLTHRVEGSYAGAFEKLKTDTNAVADKLMEIVGQLQRTSRGLRTATGEILSGANDLSERTTKQAATIEETSAAMEQLAATVSQNAQRAEEASVKTRSMSQNAQQGGEVMQSATNAMEQITASSSKISNIIGMIDDIAFQTNLLALNASVEAARAGDAGKGFAVVAVEVRRLAQSAAEASSEVKVLIEQSANEVAGGSGLVTSAAEKLASILAAIEENNALIDGIARDSREQASAIDEVNIAVRQMDEMTQHNAALVEQTNAAIEQTETQATDLDRIVGIFQIGEAERWQSQRTAPNTRPDRPQKPASRAHAAFT